jgi:hypothetical protein
MNKTSHDPISFLSGHSISVVVIGIVSIEKANEFILFVIRRET